MVLQSLRKTVSGLLDGRSSLVVLKSIGLTLVVFIAFWFGVNWLFQEFVNPWLAGWTWISSALLWILGAGLVFGASFLLAPVTAIFAGLFLDEIAEHVELKYYPQEDIGEALPLVPSMMLATRFGIVVLFANIIAFLLVFVAGFGVIIFFLVNGYFLGREYFLFAAMRFRTEREANALMGKWSLEVFLSGLAIAFVMSIPVLNLLTPVFAATLMVHLHKQVSLTDRQPE